jgi:hypothetical protein
MYGSARLHNPEAGDHAISVDPAEQSAAVAAIRASWREFPYYARRYGERGWRFSLSDSGWIETLCHSGPAEAWLQVKWLAGLLAVRGMPTYMLERHLRLLRNELMLVAPEREAEFWVLTECADRLRELRVQQIPEEPSKHLAEQFETEVRGRTAHVANMGVLIPAAVADEKAGFHGALASLESWVCDPTRFDPEWIAAVRNTVSKARSLAGL